MYSAGVGRTGTYVVLDNVLDQIEAESVVDIDGVIVKARNQRMKMVQTKVSNLHTITTLHVFWAFGSVIRKLKLKLVCKQNCLFGILSYTGSSWLSKCYVNLPVLNIEQTLTVLIIHNLNMIALPWVLSNTMNMENCLLNITRWTYGRIERLLSLTFIYLTKSNVCQHLFTVVKTLKYS